MRKIFRIHEERTGILDDIPHQDKWADAKSGGKTETAILDGYGRRQDVEGNGMGHGGSKCSSSCSAASRIFLELHVMVEEQECERV